jgi:hypothetical protein
MGLRTSKIVQQFVCDQCHDVFEYNQPTNPTEKLPLEITDKLKKLVQIFDPAGGGQAGFETMYCSDECAIEGIEQKRHRKTVQLLVAPNPSNLESAIAGDRAAKQMKRKVN